MWKHTLTVSSTSLRTATRSVKCMAHTFSALPTSFLNNNIPASKLRFMCIFPTRISPNDGISPVIFGSRTFTSSSSSSTSSSTSSSSSLPVAPQLPISLSKGTMTTTTPLVGEVDRHGGVTVDLNQLPASVDVSHFSKMLQDSLNIWKAEKKAAIWLDIPLDRSHLIAIAGDQGFEFHHAEGKRSMMKIWVRTDRADMTPQFATHQVGVSGIVIREDTKEVLVVQDKNRPHTLWKFPGGLADLGEDIDATAVREVFEETGVKSEFQSIVAFRQQHQQPGAFGRSDLYVLCRLRPLTFELKPCNEEINMCSWMSVEDLRGQVNKTSLTIRLTDILQKGMEEGFDSVDITMEQLQSIYKGFTYKLFYKCLEDKYTTTAK